MPRTYTYTITDVDNANPTVIETCGANGNYTDTPASKSFEYTFPDGLANSTVSATADDGESSNNTGSDSIDVTVNNVAPTVSITGGPTNVNEDKNGNETYTFSVSDPGNDGFTSESGYPDCGAGGSLVGSVTTTANGGSFSCRFSDGDATSTVKMQVRDADEPAGSTTADSNIATRNVTVANVAPTVNLTGANNANEGDTKTYTYTVSDPGDDTFSPAATYPNCGQYGDLVGTPTVTATGGSFQCNFPDGPNNTNVAIKVADSDGASTIDSEAVQIVAVANVNPTVTAPGPQSSDEGENKPFNLGSFSDPGPDSPWTVDVDWDDGSNTSFQETATGPITAITAKSHTYDDNGTYTVSVKVTDKNSGSDTKTFQVTVANVAPTATLGNNGPVNEGSPATVSFTGQSDPSSADTSADFHYAFHCDGSAFATAPTYSGAGTSDSAPCTFADNGSKTVKAAIIDKNGGYNEYTTTVTVNNVKPTVTAPNDDTGVEGTGKSFGLGSFTDPGINDNPWKVKVDWGDGSAVESQPDKATQGSLGNASHKYDDNGTYTVTVSVTDKDNETGSATFQVTVANVAPTADLGNNGPVVEGSQVTVTFSNPNNSRR